MSEVHVSRETGEYLEGLSGRVVDFVHDAITGNWEEGGFLGALSVELRFAIKGDNLGAIQNCIYAFNGYMAGSLEAADQLHNMRLEVESMRMEVAELKAQVQRQQRKPPQETQQSGPGQRQRQRQQGGQGQRKPSQETQPRQQGGQGQRKPQRQRQRKPQHHDAHLYGGFGGATLEGMAEESARDWSAQRKPRQPQHPDAYLYGGFGSAAAASAGVAAAAAKRQEDASVFITYDMVKKYIQRGAKVPNDAEVDILHTPVRDDFTDRVAKSNASPEVKRNLIMAAQYVLGATDHKAVPMVHQNRGTPFVGVLWKNGSR